MELTKLKDTFRARMSEWVQSVTMAAWGLLVLLTPNLFIVKQEFFTPLLNLASQDSWAIFAIIIGFARFTVLVINGSWRPSAHLRAVGCILSSFVWGGLFIAAVNSTPLLPITGIYGALLIQDILSLWFSASDAKLADLLARSDIN